MYIGHKGTHTKGKWLITIILLVLALPVVSWTAPWLDTLGRETIVCVSPKAHDEVRRAANQVVTALRSVQPQAEALDPETLIANYKTLGNHNVIVVGQWEDNIVLRATWGFWATTKPQRQWLAKGDAIARSVLALWECDIPPMAWRYRHDLFAFGYGDFDGFDVGYVQTVRNPYSLLVRLAPGSSKLEKPPLRVLSQSPEDQMRFVIHLTGLGPEAVARAVEAFLNHGLLNGVIPGATPLLLKDWTLEGLGPTQLRTDLPPWAPTCGLPDGIQYLGQQMVGSHLYAGFTEASHARPHHCWRLKYRVSTGFVLYDSYPTNRASGNELFIAEMATPSEASAATKSLEKQYPGHVATRDRYVLMHSFVGKDGANLLKLIATR